MVHHLRALRPHRNGQERSRLRRSLPARKLTDSSAVVATLIAAAAFSALAERDLPRQ
ncbi:MAG: hypothetical protein R3F65_12710 [bacterium]